MSGAYSTCYSRDVLYGNTYWDDLRFPAQAINPPGAISDPDRDVTDGTLLFDAGSTEIIMGIAQLPHKWKEGTAFCAHVHWSPTNTNTGNVLWRFEYKIANIYDAFPGSYTAADILDAGSGTDDDHLLAEFADTSMTGKTISCIVKWRLSRIGGDGTDTYNADAKLLEFDLHHQIDRPGSREEFSK